MAGLIQLCPYTFNKSEKVRGGGAGGHKWPRDTGGQETVKRSEGMKVF